MPTEIALSAPQSSAITTAQNDNSIAQVIQWAMTNNATVEQMRELYQFQREVKADQALEAYNRAFSAFKLEAVSIIKNVTVKAGPLVGTKYADLYGVVMAVTPALAKHGLTPSWSTPKDEKDWIEVQCTLRHDMGHSESVSMGGAPDVGAGRNAIQARVSAKSYLKRVTLLDITGMAASDEDDDGNGGPNPHEGQILDYTDAINASTTKEELKKEWEKADAFALAIKDLKLRKRFVDLKDSKKGAL